MTDTDISDILDGWEYDPNRNARIVAGADGRQKLQIRLRLGLIQMELDGRPDGQRPYGFETVLDYYAHLLDEHRAEHGTDEGFEIGHEAWEELSAEGILFYERYIVLFQLGDYERTAHDTARNTAMFDLCKEYAERPDDVAALEQYRPYLIRMHAASVAMQCLQDARHEEAREIIQAGLSELDELDEVHTAVFDVELNRARSMLEGMLGDISGEAKEPTELDRLHEQLARAVREERYEDAAQLRDRIRDISEHGPDDRG